MKITIDNQHEPEYNIKTVVEAHAENIDKVMDLIWNSLLAQGFCEQTIIRGADGLIEEHGGYDEETNSSDTRPTSTIRTQKSTETLPGDSGNPWDI